MKTGRTIREQLRTGTALVSALSLFVSQSAAYAMPVGGTVVGGQANISQSGNTSTITQLSNRASINWQSFDIGTGESVNFIQPSSQSIAFNRVTGSQNPSQILGSMTANGQVWLVNPNGVFFGQGAQVNVGGLLATTAGINDTNFMNGNYIFDQAGNPNATIRNSGIITIADGGLAALVGPNVSNDGLIQAKLGKVQLGSGDTFTLDLYGDGLINLQASPAMTQQIVSNSGVIQADGGSVELTPAAAQNTVNSLINMSGIIQADSIGEKNGVITIYAEGSNAVQGNVAANKGQKSGTSTVLVSGILDASGYRPGEKGGSISVLGDNVGILNGAFLDASGDTGGGTIKIGGDFHGAGTTPTAMNTYVDANALIFANANSSGNGGNVTVWADGNTFFEGNILAEGGSQSGNGGFVETSGHSYLDAQGYVDVTAMKGQMGTWLLDPTNISIYGGVTPAFNSSAGIADGTQVSLSSNLKLWLDASDTSNVTLTYNSTGTTVTLGTSGSNTITVGSNTGLVVGERIQLGGVSDSLLASVNDNAGSSGVYTITNISGTTITLDTNLASTATGATVYGGYISQLTDKSGQGNNVTQATGSAMPLWISNGLNGIGAASFNGSSDSMAASFAMSQPNSQFVTFQANVVTGDTYIYDGASVNNNVVFLYASKLGYYAGISDATLSGVAGGGYAASTGPTYLYNILANGASSTSYLNGGNQLAGNPGPQNINGITLGAVAGGSGEFFNGIEGDVVFYNGTISTAGRNLISQYESAKWGIALTGPGNATGEAGLTGAEAQAAMASTQAGATTDGYSVFSASYLNRLSQTSNIILQAGNNINLDLQGNTLSLAAGKNITLAAGNAISNVSAGTITTSQSAGSGGNISFSAGTDIVLSGMTLNSNGGAITLASNTANAGGAISLTNGALNSGGGAITLGGGATPATTPAVGDAAHNSGIYLFGPTLNAGGGDISLRGTAFSGGAYDGIDLWGVEHIQTTGSGNISLTGTSNGTIGLYSASSASTISAVNGTINITGTAAANAGALYLTGSNITSTGSGAINLTGNGGLYGIYTTGTIGGASASGDIIVKADSLAVGTLPTVQTTGNVAFKTNTATTTIGVAGGAGALQITQTILNATQAGTVVIGDNVHSGLVTVNATDLSGDNFGLDIKGVASVALNGNITTNNKDLTIEPAVTLGVDSTVAAGVGTLTFGSTVNGPHNLTATADTINFGGTLGGGVALGNVNLTSTSALTLPSITAASILARTTGATSDLTIASGKTLTASGGGTAITLASGRNFINNAGSGALSAASGRWLVYSTNPANDTVGSLANDFRRFTCAYGGSCPALGTGNGLLYSYTPTLTATPSAVGITYGDAVPNLAGYGYAITAGYLGSDSSSDSLSGSLTGTTNYTQGSGVGSYRINYSSGSLTSALGYGFTYANNVTAITVGQKALGITAADQTHNYGFGNLGTTGFTTSGLYGSDAISGVTLSTSDGTSTSGNFKATVGPATLTPSAAVFSSGSSGNYAITYNNAATGLTVNKATLTISGFAASNKTYDGTTNATIGSNGSLSGIVGSDSVTLNSGSASATFGSKNAGGETATAAGYSLTSGNGNGDAGNYNLTQPTASATIAALGLTVTADAKSKTQGSIDPSLTYSYTGLVAGDANATFTGALARASGETLGDYVITQNTLAATGNYTIGLYNPALLSVVAAPASPTLISAQVKSEISATIFPQTPLSGHNPMILPEPSEPPVPTNLDPSSGPSTKPKDVDTFGDKTGPQHQGSLLPCLNFVQLSQQAGSQASRPASWIASKIASFCQ